MAGVLGAKPCWGKPDTAISPQHAIPNDKNRGIIGKACQQRLVDRIEQDGDRESNETVAVHSSKRMKSSKGKEEDERHI